MFENRRIFELPKFYESIGTVTVKKKLSVQACLNTSFKFGITPLDTNSDARQIMAVVLLTTLERLDIVVLQYVPAPDCALSHFLM